MRSITLSNTLFIAAAIAATSLFPQSSYADDAPNAPLSNADAQAMLWPSTPLVSTPPQTVTQSDFTAAATRQFSMLSALRTWRDTLDGSGSQARRDLFQGHWLGTSVGLSLGSVAPPSASGVAGAGIAAHFGALDVGTTARPREVGQALASWDGLMTGSKSAPSGDDGQSQMWLRARPWQSKTGGIEFDFSRAARDIAPGEAQQWQQGDFYSSQGNIRLPLRWNLKSSWTMARLDDADAKQTWQTGLSGPITHPFGEANVSLQWNATDAGFANLNSSDPNGSRTGSLSVTQGVKTGPIDGQLRVDASRQSRDAQTSALAADQLEARAASGSGDLRLHVAPSVSLNAKGSVGTLQTRIAGEDFSTTAATTQDEVQTRDGDVGMEWRMGGARALALSASVGRSQTLNWRDPDGDGAAPWTTIPGSDENRLTFGLRHPASGLAATVSACDRDDPQLVAWRRMAMVHLEAQRRLISAFKIKTILDFAHDRDAAWSDQTSLARHMEAQLLFGGAARLDLKFRDGAALPSQWLSTDIGSLFNDGLSTGDQQFGAQFNAGSAANGKGLGFSVGFSRGTRAGTEDQMWRVGLTYR